MITLNGQREIAGCQVYRDDVDALAWYVMPQAPTLAMDENGKPSISLAMYRRDVSQLTEEERKTRLGGGILSLSVELRPTDEQEREIREAIASDPKAQRRVARRNPQLAADARDLAAAIKLGTVPIKDGLVTLAILGETTGDDGTVMPGSEFINSLVGVGRVSMVGRQRASFMAKLSQDGAVMLWEMMERDLAALRVAYDLSFDHRLNAVRMSVWCDAKKTYEATQEQWQNLSDRASWSVRRSGNSTRRTFGRTQSISARETLGIVAEDSQNSRVTITPGAGADVVSPEITEELIRSGNEMISEFLAATFLQWNPGAEAQFADQPELETELAEHDGKKYGSHTIDYYNLKEWNEEMSATLNHHFTSKAVIEGHLGPNANMTGVLAGHDPDDFRVQIDLDHDYYKYLDVQVLCTSDFEEDPVDLVKAHLEYDERGSQGSVHEVKDFAFRKDSQPQNFLTFLADPDKKSYDYEYEVFYRGTDETYTVKGKTDETILVLDTDRMGILRVEVFLGLVNWEQVKSVFVKMWFGGGSDRKETEFALNEGNQSFLWNQVIAKALDEPYHYQITFVDQTGQKIEHAPESSRSGRLIINQPQQESMEVAIVPAGSFGDGGMLSKVVVAMRYRDGDYLVDDIFTLSGEDDSKVWEVPLLNDDRREYEYQTTVFYADGVTREDDWQKSDKSVLALGDPFGYRVQISPYLLKDKGFAFGTLHLEFHDAAADIRVEKTLEITDFGTPLFWRFRLGAPDRHTYTYQLTLFTTEGEEKSLPPAQGDKEVLVLRPPTD
ncbi:MAG: hypothetical protein AAF481_12305 [Acidobacteriota bacterium]